MSTPVGAVWFYDVSDEARPRYLSHVSASQLEREARLVLPADPNEPAADTLVAQGSCTAHHGRLIPVADGDVLAMSFYGAGVIVIDFADLRNEGPHYPTVVARYRGAGANVWETWYYNGYLYTGDLGRGMDVLRIT